MVTEFQEAIESAGLTPGDLVPGKWVRFPGIGKKASNKDGYAHLFEDGLGGIFGDFSCGLREVWQAHKVAQYSPDERADFDAMVRESRAKADEEQAEAWEVASEKARDFMKGCVPYAMTKCGYCHDKGVKSYGLRMLPDDRGLTVMPLKDHRNQVMSYQTIAPDGTKRFMTGGKKKGCVFIIPGDKSKTYVVEGYATGATIHEATGCRVVVALDAGNLLPVVEVLISKNQKNIVIAADNDAGKDYNTGIEKAKAICNAFAEITMLAPPVKGDWNDYHVAHGLDRVKALLEPPLTSSISIKLLMAKTFQPLRWAVPGIIPEGLTILAGRPKFGKSWLMLGLAYAVATGGMAWNFAGTIKANVHALFLEDSHRRIQSRVQHMEGYFNEYPDNLNIYVDFPRIGEGFAEELDAILERDPNCGLIIIDTLQKIRPKSGGRNQNMYQSDYEDYERLQKWSITNGVPVVCIHHTRKGEAGQAANPFDEISGSTGLQGVADTLIVVCKPDKNKDEGIMYVTGREVTEAEYPMMFDYSNCTWEVSAPTGSSYDDTEDEFEDYWKQGHEAITAKEATKVWTTNLKTARAKLDAMVEAGDLCKRTKDRKGAGRPTTEYYRSGKALYTEESAVVRGVIEPQEQKNEEEEETYDWT